MQRLDRVPKPFQIIISSAAPASDPIKQTTILAAILAAG